MHIYRSKSSTYENCAIPSPGSAPRRRPLPTVGSGARTVQIVRVPAILQKNPQSLMKSTRGPGPLSPPFPYPLPTLFSGGGRIRRRCRARARCGSGRARPDAAAGGSVGCRCAAGWPGATSRPLSFPLFPYKRGQARRPSATGAAPRGPRRPGVAAGPHPPSHPLQAGPGTAAAKRSRRGWAGLRGAGYCGRTQHRARSRPGQRAWLQ